MATLIKTKSGAYTIRDSSGEVKSTNVSNAISKVGEIKVTEWLKEWNEKTPVTKFLQMKIENEFETPSFEESDKEVESILSDGYEHSSLVERFKNSFEILSKEELFSMKNKGPTTLEKSRSLKWNQLRIYSRQFQVGVALIANFQSCLKDGKKFDFDSKKELLPYKAEGGIKLLGREVIILNWGRDYVGLSSSDNEIVNRAVFQIANNFDPYSPTTSIFSIISKFTGLKNSDIEKCVSLGSNAFSGDGLYEFWSFLDYNQGEELEKKIKEYKDWNRINIKGWTDNYLKVFKQAQDYLEEKIKPSLTKMMSSYEGESIKGYNSDGGWCALGSIRVDDEEQALIDEGGSFDKSKWTVWLNGNHYSFISKQPYGWFYFEELEDWSKTKKLKGYGQTHR